MLTARRIALTVLVRVERGGAFANRALDAELQSSGRLDPRDAALATELVYGTLRRQLFIDHALAPLCRTPLTELDHETRALLRLGAHQILHLRVPERAAVHTTVELSKEIRRGRSSSLVNAVLRALARSRDSIALPDPDTDPAGHLALSESIPRWLADRSIEWWGLDEARQFFAASNEPALLTLRVNRLRSTREEAAQSLTEVGIEVRATAHSPAGLQLEEARAPAGLLRPESGAWQAQDEAAQLVGFYCDPKPGSRVLDACAAPGGKSCHLAELMDDRGRVDAVDVHAGKARDIEEGARRLGLQSVQVHAADASLPLPFAPEEGYELALVDAPCSGLGTLRRHPELKLRRTFEDVVRLAQLQARILDNVAKVVRPGGLLVYALCTVTPLEGSGQIERFLSAHPEFEREPPPAGPVDWTGLLDERGDLLLLPHRHGTDGFYAARLRRCS